MKEILVSCLLLISVCATAQLDTTEVKFIEPPDSTAIGTADGKLVNKEIGPLGGRIVSEDGRIELIFPEGALTANTIISIEPTINLAPNGTGKSYQCEPSGIQFKKPVQIIFHYTEEDEEEAPPELMGLAMQDRTGKWSFINYEDWDSTTRTLKGLIHHFTTFSKVNNLQLYPDHTLLMVGKTTFINVLDLSVKYTEPPKYGAAFLEAIVDGDAPRLWFVNGFENGNSSVGTIQPSEYKFFGKAYGTLARYTAPRYMLPKKVTIRLHIYVRSRDPKVYYRKRKLTCKIEIYDAYEVKIKGEFTLRTGMNSRISDHATFLLYLYINSMKIDRIQNYTPVVEKEGSRRPFKEEISVKAGFFGSINITNQVKNYHLSKDSPPEVFFEFLTATTYWCQARYSARGIKGDWQDVTGETVPRKIIFVANREQQDIPVRHESGGVYHLIIKPFQY